jgi:hypothetical protein
MPGPRPVFFVQGAGGMREQDGSGRLVAYLERELGLGYRVIAPEMPNADNPRYRPWRDRIERELAAIDEAVSLVGHSFGGSVLLKYLAEGSFDGPIAGLFLVSVPDWGTEGWAYEEFAVPDDVASKLPATEAFLYHSREDPEVPFDHLRLNEQRLPAATSRRVAGAEHSFVKGLPELVADIRAVTRS